MFILCCSIAFNLHKFEKRRQNYTYFHKLPNIFVSFLHFQPIFTFFRFAISRILCNFAPESIKSSSLLRLTRQPSFGNHGGQYDAEAILFTSKHIYYIKFALRFVDMQIPELITVFNAQVQNRGWSSMRAYHDQALLDEFLRRGIDTTAVSDGRAVSFAHPVRYDLPNNKLVVIN